MGRGALIFKGDAAVAVPQKKGTEPKKKKRKLHENGNDPIESIRDTAAGQPTGMSTYQHAVEPSLKNQSHSPPQIVVGRGKITVSGTVVTGYETKFNSDVRVGDALLVQNEMRVITMRLSDISLNLSSPFSPSVVTSKPISYSYICKPRDVTRDSEQEQRKAAIEKAADIERHQNAFASITTGISTNAVSAVGLDSNDTNNTVVYRERTEHGNYRIKQMKIADGSVITNRSEMLDIRSRKTSDKYC